MSLGSPSEDNFLTQLEALQKNLNDLLTHAKTLSFSQNTHSEEDAYELSDELFFKMNSSGEVLNMNGATLRTLSYPKEELTGLHFVDIVTHENKKRTREFLSKLGSGFPSVSFEVSLTKKDNTRVDVVCKAIKRENFIYALAALQSNEIHRMKDFYASSANYAEKERFPVAAYPEAFKVKTPREILGTNANDDLWPQGHRPINPATMSTVDINGFIVDVNDRWLEMLGYKREEILGREILLFFEVNNRRHIADELIPEIASSGTAKSGKCYMYRKDGSMVEVILSGSLEYSSIQKIFKWLIFPTSQEVGTVEENAKTNVVEGVSFNSEHHLKAIINSSKQILFLIDKKMDVIAFNKHAEKVILEHAGKKLKIGSNIANFLPDADAQGLQEIYSDVLDGRSVHFTREMTFHGKGKRWFEVNLFPVEDELIHINNVVFSAEDISERKLAEEKFKELEINFKSIFTQVAVGVMLYDLNNESIQANKRFYELIEYSKEEFEIIQPIGITHPEDRDKSIKHTEDLVSGKIDNYSLEKRYVTKSGRIVWVYLTATVVKNRQGKPKHIISVAQDITLRKTAEQELIYKKSELDTFVYRASHDLRGPVASLMGLYNIVKVEFAHDKNAITYFEHYNNSVMRLHTVLQNLIDLTKIKESETKLTQVDLKELIDSCLNSMKNLADYQRISFDVQIDITFKVFIDGKKFKTIVKNLVENSIIYSTPESNAFVKILVTYQENVLKIEVIDNGRGIDPRIQSKVFNMFFRGTEKSKGSGLGLYIVKNAVEKLNGSIQLSSKLNEGTKFSVYIPYLYGQEYSALLEKNFVN